MMKITKRFLALGLCLVLAAGVLSGCRKKTEGGETGSVPTLIWWQIGSQPADLAAAVAKMNEYTEQKIGVKVDIRYAGWDVWEEKIKSIVNTGEYYDIMFTNTNKYTSHASLGAFADLTELLNTAAPDLKAFVPDELWKAVKIQGKIYAVPTYKDSSSTQYFVWDKAMVEKYDVDYENLKTLKDLDPVLRHIKAGEEAATGKKCYPFPLAKEGFNGIFMEYDNYVKYDDPKAQVLNTYERPEIVENLTILHKWYTDGIINPDASTLGEPPKYRVCYSAQGFPGADAVWSKTNGYTTVSTPYAGPIYSTGSILGSVNAISANSKHKEAALKYLQLANTDPVLRNMLAYGIEGQHWKNNGDGTITKLTDTWTAPLYSQATFFTVKPESPNPPNQWKLLEEQNEKATPSVILGFTLDESDIEAEITNVESVKKKYEAELLTGVKDPATFLPQFNKELRAAGLDTVLAETQKQVNAFLGK